MDSLEEILGEYMELVTDIHFDKTSYQVAVRFGNQIKPIQDTSNKVGIKDMGKGVYIYSITKSNGLDTLALFLKKTVDQNLEAHAKGKLYDNVIQNLQQIFKENSLEDLQTLRFVFGKDAEDIVTTDKPDFTKQLENSQMNADEVVMEELEKHETIVEDKVCDSTQTEPEWVNEQEESDSFAKVDMTKGLPSGKVNVIM